MNALRARVCILSILSFMLAQAQAQDVPPDIFPANLRVLFQGDSITDMNRGRTSDPNHILGHSYAFLIAAKYGSSYPERNLIFINRGISGNRVPDLAKRWKADTLDLKPDVLSILIGVNDVGFALRENKPFSIEDYQKTYDQLLADAVEANPRIKFILCEPFILPGKNTTPRWDEWQKAIAAEQGIVEKLATKYRAPLVRLQKLFDAAAKKNVSADYWIWDGIHPTYSGQQLLADEWVRTFNDFYCKKQATKD
jgi:lysophospholipase L1-like esterase